MSVTSNPSSANRVISAFFDTAGAARQATDDLIAAGIPAENIAQTGGQDAVAETSVEGDHRGFWAGLKDFFLPEEDRSSYDEGLRRGGFLVAVTTDDADHARVMAILDTDGAVDMDHREKQWRQEGWSHDAERTGSLFATDPQPAGLMAGTVLSAGANAVTIPSNTASAAHEDSGSRTAPQAADDSWRHDDAARAAALDGSVPAAVAAARAASRDDSHGRSRLRSYVRDGGSREAAPGSFSPLSDAALIIPDMDVISADGQTIGTVDHLDGPDRIKLARSTAPDGQHHLVPFAWIDHVDQHVHLRKTLAEIKAGR